MGNRLNNRGIFLENSRSSCSGKKLEIKLDTTFTESILCVLGCSQRDKGKFINSSSYLLSGHMHAGGVTT